MTPEELLNEVGEPVAYFSDEFFSINTKQNATFNDPLFSSDQVAAAILKATGPLEKEIERLKTVPMKYRRMAFNAQLQDENNELRTQLAAAAKAVASNERKTVMDIKEIALRIGEEADEYADAKLQSKGEFHPDWHTVRDEYFAEAIIAELAKQNEPVAFTNSAQLGYVTSGQHQDIPLAMWSRNTSYSGADIPLYTLPPTAEQIANETAEACARYVNRFINGDGILNEVWISEIEEALRNGAWKEFKK